MRYPDLVDSQRQAIPQRKRHSHPSDPSNGTENLKPEPKRTGIEEKIQACESPELQTG
jgi:hypothetical protein